MTKYLIFFSATFFYWALVTAFIFSFYGKIAAVGTSVGCLACFAGGVGAMRMLDLAKKISKNASDSQTLQITGYAHIMGIFARMGIPLTVALIALFFYKGGMDKDFSAAILISYLVYYPFTLVVELILTHPGKKGN